MANLLNRILSNRKHLGQSGIIHPDFVDVLPHADILDVQNVAEYYYESPQDQWDWNKDFPNIAPPFEFSWMEWEVPPTILLPSGLVELKETERLSIGLSLSYMESKHWKEATKEAQGQLPKWVFMGHLFFYHPTLFSATSPTGIISAATILMPITAKGETYLGGRVDHDVVSLGVNFFDSLDDLFSGVRGGAAVIPSDMFSSQVKMTPDQAYSFLIEKTNIPFLSISFLHCKNIKRVAKADNPTPKEQAKRIKVGKLPLVEYKTLVIAPMKEVIRQANGGESDTLSAKALHICRGHFRNYDQKPLFGKYKGNFFIPQHARGNIRNGEVKKDYKVDTSHVL